MNSPHGSVWLQGKWEADWPWLGTGKSMTITLADALLLLGRLPDLSALLSHHGPASQAVSDTAVVADGSSARGDRLAT